MLLHERRLDMGIKQKSPEVRYWTYYMHFPGEMDDPWIDQTPFIHDLQFELKNTTFGKDPELARNILLKGECQWKDHNGVTHRVVVDDTIRVRKWGKRQRVH
jgi:hypothetical protein